MSEKLGLLEKERKGEDRMGREEARKEVRKGESRGKVKEENNQESQERGK